MRPTTTTASVTPSPAVQAVGFDKTYHVDGLDVRIAEVREDKLGPVFSTSDGSGKEGDPYQILTAHVANRSSAPVDLMWAAVLTYGPEAREAAQVELRTPDQLQLEPGESTDYPFGFLIPAEFVDDVTLEVTITSDPLRTAVFSGPLRPH
jgi:hypothetical protein